MQERILGAVLGGVRLVLVVVALVVAGLPIARAATSGFCPAGEEAAAVLAAPVGGGFVLAEATTTDTPTPTQPDTTTDAPTDPLEGGTDAPTDAGTDGAGLGDQGPPGEEQEEVGPCGPGVDRCLPPLVSAVVSFGGGVCGAEAVDMLQGSMLPAFGIATVLLVGAWLLRPRHGAPVISRW